MKYTINLETSTINIEGVVYKIAPKRCAYTHKLIHQGYEYLDEYIDNTELSKDLLVDSIYNLANYGLSKTHGMIYSELFVRSNNECCFAEWKIEDEFYTENGLYFTQNNDGTWSFAQIDLTTVDEIQIIWCTIDVIHRANSRGFLLTPTQANEILNILCNDHDASIGINWDVIDTVTDNYLSE